MSDTCPYARTSDLLHEVLEVPGDYVVYLSWKYSAGLTWIRLKVENYIYCTLLRRTPF